MILLISLLITLTIIIILAAAIFPRGDMFHEKSTGIIANNGPAGIRHRSDLLHVGLSFQSIEKYCIFASSFILNTFSLMENTEKRIRRARLSEEMSVIEYTAIRIGIIFLIIFINSLSYMIIKRHLPFPIMLAVIAILIYIPDYILDQRGAWYDDRVTLELPQTIDLLLICTEGGMGLFEALEVVAQKKGGTIGSELGLCIQEIKIGIRIQDSLSNFAKRNRTREVQMFVNSMTQAIRMGTPTSTVLRNLSASIRENERQRIENKIGSIPMKLTLVTMIFFMPLVFIIVLFPSLLSFMQSGW